VGRLVRAALAQGSSAARQRVARATGGLRNVVDMLLAETRATPVWLPVTRPACSTVTAAR